MVTNNRAILIDDEKHALNSLKIIIKEFAPEIEIVGMASSAKEGLELIEEKLPDVVFLDIQMPHMSGIELMESIDNNRTFKLVFLTAFNNFAQEAFQLNAFDYLLKPVSIPKFLELAKKLNNNSINTKNHQDILKKSFQNKLAIPSSDGIEFITISDIIRIEASGSYVIIYTTNNKPKMFSRNLKSMEKLLVNHAFFRVHKSHLINLNYVKNYSSQKDGGTITMIDGSLTYLSRKNKEEFISLYKLI